MCITSFFGKRVISNYLVVLPCGVLPVHILVTREMPLPLIYVYCDSADNYNYLNISGDFFSRGRNFKL